MGASYETVFDNFYKEKLEEVLDIVREYLPPDSNMDVHEAMSKIIEIVDPWPVEGDK